MDEKIKELRDRLCELNERAQTIQATADAEKRALTEDEEKEVRQIIFTQFPQIQAEIQRREEMNKQTTLLTQPQGRKAEPQVPEPPAAVDVQNSVAQPRNERRPAIQFVTDRGKRGFPTMGHFAQAVQAACAQNGAVIDPRLIMDAPTTVSTEGSGGDGGYAVPPDYRTEIWKKVAGEASLFARTDQYPTSRNTIVLPADENAPWDTTNGVQAYFESENGLMTQSKIQLKDKTIRLNKLTALVPVTEELLEDAPSLDAYLRTKVAEKFDFKLNLKLVQGTGAGEPLGILNAASTVSVAKETSQAADTIQVENIDKMYSRLYAPLRPGAIWLCNQDIEPQLFGMTRYVKDASGTIVGGTPAYMPPGGISGRPYGTLYGLEVVPTQACETLGDKGDIVLVQPKMYLTAFKQGGVRTDVSMHLWFDYATLAFRFLLRIAGMPWWSEYITPRDGTNYPSWAVTLDERAG